MDNSPLACRADGRCRDDSAATSRPLQGMLDHRQYDTLPVLLVPRTVQTETSVSVRVCVLLELTSSIWKFLGTDLANIVRTYELATDELSRTRNVLEEGK